MSLGNIAGEGRTKTTMSLFLAEHETLNQITTHIAQKEGPIKSLR